MRKVKKRKGIEEQRVKYFTPPLATDALIGNEEQSGKQKNEKIETEIGSSTSAIYSYYAPFSLLA